MFTEAPFHPPRSTVSVVFDGRRLTAEAGQSVAAALASAGITATRETPSGSPRSAYCMMGVCFECLVSIDGVPGRQGCLVRVRDGMSISSNTASTS